jgi:hypothetical protein
MAQLIPPFIFEAAKSKHVLVCYVPWSLNMLTYLSDLRLYPSMRIGVKAELKLNLCLIMFHAMKISKAGGTGSLPSHSNASRKENRTAPDSVWTLRGREKFLLLPEIKPQFLSPAAGILVTLVNVLHNGMDA